MLVLAGAISSHPAVHMLGPEEGAVRLPSGLIGNAAALTTLGTVDRRIAR